MNQPELLVADDVDNLRAKRSIQSRDASADVRPARKIGLAVVLRWGVCDLARLVQQMLADLLRDQGAEVRIDDVFVVAVAYDDSVVVVAGGDDGVSVLRWGL